MALDDPVTAADEQLADTLNDNAELLDLYNEGVAKMKHADGSLHDFVDRQRLIDIYNDPFVHHNDKRGFNKYLMLRFAPGLTLAQALMRTDNRWSQFAPISRGHLTKAILAFARGELDAAPVSDREKSLLILGYAR